MLGARVAQLGLALGCAPAQLRAGPLSPPRSGRLAGMKSLVALSGGWV
jgi:hypothetical protein